MSQQTVEVCFRIVGCYLAYVLSSRLLSILFNVILKLMSGTCAVIGDKQLNEVMLKDFELHSALSSIDKVRGLNYKLFVSATMSLRSRLATSQHFYDEFPIHV